MTKIPWKWAAWVAAVTLMAAGPPGWAASSDAPPAKDTATSSVNALSPPAEASKDAAPATGADADIKALREQINALDQKVKVLERQKEVDKEDATAKAKTDAEKAKTTPVISWKDGFTIKTPDEKYSLRIGGWAMFDWAGFSEDKKMKASFGDEQDGVSIRSARLQINGQITKYLEYRVELEFAGENGMDTPSFYETYIQVDHIPYLPQQEGRLRIGHFREPFSMEDLTSTPYITFAERSLQNVFAPDYNPGVQWASATLGDAGHERLTYALGVFKTTDNWPSAGDSDENGGYNVTGRVTGLPWYQDDGEKLLHLGFGYSHRTPNGQTVGLNARSESRLAAFRYANADATGTTFPPALFRLTSARAKTINEFNGEALIIVGPFSAQGEYTNVSVDTSFAGTRNFSGYYVQASGFLTPGDHRTYRNIDGLPDRIRPQRNFGWGEGEKGAGAWELALRWSSVDLSSGPVRGGSQDSLTAAVNWYLNPQARFTINYIHNWVRNEAGKGNFDILETRFGVQF